MHRVLPQCVHENQSSQERHAQLDERVIDAERKLSECREQQRTLERLAQEATFSQRSLEARRSEIQRGLETAGQQIESIHAEQERAKDELTRLTDAAAQAGLQNALAIKMSREQVLAAKDSSSACAWICLSDQSADWAWSWAKRCSAR